MPLVTSYMGPFGGLNTDNPPVIIQPNEAAQCDNFMLRNNYIGTRPRTSNFLSAPPDGLPCSGIWTCWNSANNTYYVYMTTLNNLYVLNIGNTWSPAISGTGLAGILNTNFINALGNSYFVNGSGNIYQVSGITNSVLTNLYGAQFIMELAQTMLICNTYESGVNYPQRIRWCNGGNITQWDPFTYVGAGFADLLDISDQITGTLAMGSVGYIMRKNGITQITPTGNGIQPWYFNHLWASEHGVGMYYPDTVAQYGSLAFMLAEDNVYIFTPSSFETIADKNIASIITDIQDNAYGMYAAVVPRKAYNYYYFTYEIYILQQYGMIVWSYEVPGKRWTRKVNSSIQLSAKPSYLTATSIAF